MEKGNTIAQILLTHASLLLPTLNAVTLMQDSSGVRLQILQPASKKNAVILVSKIVQLIVFSKLNVALTLIQPLSTVNSSVPVPHLLVAQSVKKVAISKAPETQLLLLADP